MSSITEKARELGLPATGRGREYDGTQGLTITWTTRREVAEQLEQMGASISAYTSRDPEFSGWEIRFPVGT